MMPNSSLRALCLTCSKVAPAHYDVRHDGVFLVRNCPPCGTTEARFTKDLAHFDRIVSIAERANQETRGLIVELLDGCNIQCPTCIATSGPFAGNLRATMLLKNRMSRVVERQKLKAILLSGGEPTIHPDFLDIVTFTAALDVPARVLITNGLRFAAEPDFLRAYVDAGGAEMETFLQWDSLRAEALRNIRGHDYSTERIAALAGLSRFGITTTLVNVVKRGVTLEHIDEVLDVARKNANVVGVQFQPIRDAGRVLNFTREENSCEVTDVFDQLPKRIRLAPCPSSPWSTFLGWMDRRDGTLTTDGEGDDFYISPTNSTPPEKIRVSVLDYSDRFNWTSERSRLASLNVLDEVGRTPSVDDYFLNISS